MSERHAEMQRSITMIIDMPDGTTQAMTVAVNIDRWFNDEYRGIAHRLAVHDAIYAATRRLIELSAGKLSG